MSFLSLVGVEFKKIKRSKIFLILFVATVILWIPSILNAEMNFNMQAEGISPENNFFIQGFMGMAWFMFPASMVVGTVLLSQTERTNKGILKMLALPISTVKLCLAKFVVLLALAASQILMMVGMYYISAAIVTGTQDYNFILSPLFVFKEVGFIAVSTIPMLAFFWLLAVCIQTPIFSIGIGLASIVPSVLMINTKAWFAYPMSYPFFVITSEYGKLATNLTTSQVEFFRGYPWQSPSPLFACAFPASVLGRQKGDKTIMKNKILTAISTIMLFVPWTILPLRTFDWALESPVAEIMISCYAAFMIFSGIFTIVSYAKAKVQNNLMKVDLVVNSLYAIFGVCAFILMAVTKFS